MSTAIVKPGGPPDWVTPRIAEMMRDQVLAAVREAGHYDVEAHEMGDRNWHFTGAPREVIAKAGELVARSWRVHERGE